MAVTAALLRRIRKALPPVHVVCCVGAVGAVMRGTAVSRAAPTSAPPSGTAPAGCASPSPVCNEDLLRRKRRMQNARKHSACRPDKEAGRAPKNHKALCSDSNTKRSARDVGRNALCLTSKFGESPRALADIKTKKLRSECSEFLFVVAPTGIEPVFHA